MKQRWTLPSLSILLALAIWIIPAPIIRYALAFVLLWVIPGLAWIALFPSKKTLSRPENFITGLGLNFVVTTLTLLLLYYIPGPLTQWQILIAVPAITVLPTAILSISHKQNTQEKIQREDSKTDTSLDLPPSFFSKEHPFWRNGWAWLLIAILIAAGLRIVNLGYSEFQGDEGTVMVRAAKALEGDDTIIFQHKKGPSELMTVMGLWRLTGITNEWMARLPFTWANLLGIAAVFLIARRVTTPRAAGIAANILAIEGYFTAFGRIVQYQSIVFALSGLGLLCLLAYHKTNRTSLVFLSAALFAGGFLGHYDAALTLPAGLLLIGDRLWQDRDQGWRLLRPIGIAALLGLVLITIFYLPFLKSPFMDYTQTYLSERLLGETQASHNNLWRTFNLSAVYDSIYHIAALVLLIGAQLLYTWTRWNTSDKSLQKSAGQKALWIFPLTAVLLCIMVITTLIWPERWVIGESFTVAWLPMLILLAGALLAPQQPMPRRALWLWLTIPALFYLFIVASPNTHVHTFFAAGIILASAEAERLALYLNKHAKTLNYAIGIFSIAIYMLCGYYIIIIFVSHTPEYRRTYPEFKNSLYWVPYEEIPKDGLFGFPYRAGWKVVGNLIDQGTITSYYKSNEEPPVTDYYTRQATWWHCPAPDLYFAAVNVQDELSIDWGQIQRDYQPVAIVEIGGQPKLTIHQREDTTQEPTLYDGEAHDWAFDLHTTPDNIAWGMPKVSTTLPASYNPLAYTLGDLANLRGYDLETDHAHPEGYIDLTLYWEVIAPTNIDYHVFTHMHDGEIMRGQSDRQPVCNSTPTSNWKPGQIIRDRYRIFIDPNAPLGSVPLVIGMYDLETMQRLPVKTDEGTNTGDSVYITDIIIQEP